MWVSCGANPRDVVPSANDPAKTVMKSRRDFLRQLAASGAFSFTVPHALSSPWLGGALQRSPAAGTMIGGLFFGGEDTDRLRSLYASETFAELRERISNVDRAAERSFLADDVRYNDQLFHLPRVSRTAEEMAFHYLMTGDEDAAELAASCMEAMSKFDRWDYFLEGGDRVFGLQRAPQASVSTSLCWDWLEGYADADTRRQWLQLMGDRGCEPSWLGLYGMRYPDRVEGWSIDETSSFFEHRPDERIDLSNWPHILDRTNLKAVPASALAVSAVAYAREFGEDERVEKWIEQAIFSLRTFRDLFATDGSYDEGVSYANYTTSHIAQATVVLERYNGVSLFDEINWAGYIDYLCGMSMATAIDPAGIVNFGDAGGGATAAVPYWIAGRAGDERARWFGDAMSREKDMWSLLWHPGDVKPERPEQALTLWHSSLDWMVARTGHRPGDLVVAMRSGGPANHEHADRNSIIVKWGGEILIADPYRPPYAFADPSWMMRTTAGHSSVLVDGEGHQYHDGSEGTNPSDAVAHIIRSGERDGFVFWTSDATPAYQLVNPDVKSITRSVYVFGDSEIVLILDKLRKRQTPSVIEARFFGDNREGFPRHLNTLSGGDKQAPAPSGGCKISVADGSRAAMIIERPLASAAITSVSPSGVKAEAARLPIPEETAALHPFGAMRTVDPSLAPMLLTVVAPYQVGPPPVDIRENEDGTFDLDVRTDVGRVVCRIRDVGAIPDVMVESA